MRKIYSEILRPAAAAVALLASISAAAVPAFPGYTSVTQPDGTEIVLRLTGDEHAHVTVDRDGYEMIPDSLGFWRRSGRKGAESLARKAADARGRRFARIKSAGGAGALWNTSFPCTGTPRSLVVLVDFPDIPFRTDDVHTVFDRMLNQPGFDSREHIGSAADYFRTQSMGQFSPVFDLYGPVRASHPATYYGENDANGDDARAHELAMELCRKLNGKIDFSDYDLDDDGQIDNLYFFYAGYGENFAGNKADWIWPHANHINLLGVPEGERTFDGKVLNSYGCCAELYGSTGADVAAIGPFCHEFSHILGLPDTYDVNYAADGRGFHPDQWDIMASGSYLPATRNCGAVPAGYSALERWLLGWAEPTDITRPQGVTLPPLHESAMSVRISTQHPDEFFLLENRQRTAGTYDRYLPSDGMLVWHVDRRPDATITVTIGESPVTISCAEAWNLENNAVNMNASHQCLDLMKASGSGSRNSEDTPFPGRQLITSITDDTTPSLRSWSGEATDSPVTDIRQSGDMISFSFMGSDLKLKVGGAVASEVTAESFTASWTPADAATDGYKVRLHSVERSEPREVTTLDANFLSLPEGWEADADVTFGEGAVTLGKSAVNTLISPEVDLAAGGTLEITARQGGSTPGTLKVMCGESEIATYLPSSNYSRYSLTIPPMAGSRRLSLVSERRKPVSVNRITLTQEIAEVTLTPVKSHTAETVPGVSAHTFTSLEAGTEYAFTVEARGFASSASDPVFVTTLGAESSLPATEAGETCTAEWYTVTGIHLPKAPSAPGIYVCRRGAKSEKIIVR